MGSHTTCILGVGNLSIGLRRAGTKSSRSDAEITAGVIIGCLPVMPALFRHFVPKIKTHFSSYRRSKNQSVSHSGPSVASANNPVAAWEDPYRDSRGLNNSYLELDDKKHSPTSNVGREGALVQSIELSTGLPIQDTKNYDLESGSSSHSVFYR